MYGPVLGASTTTVGALTLANTGSNAVVEAAAIAAIIVGIVVALFGLARHAAAKANI